MNQQIDFSLFGQNAGFIEELYNLYLADPALVDASWAQYFSSINGIGDAVESAQSIARESVIAAPTKNGNHHNLNGQHSEIAPVAYAAPSAKSTIFPESRFVQGVARLVDAYRLRGHLRANFNPVKRGVLQLPECPELDPSFYSLTRADLDSEISMPDFGAGESMSCQTMLKRLDRIYCGPIGFEFMHVRPPEERHWLQEKIENGTFELQVEQKKRLLKKLILAELFESELHRKFVGAKRFSLQGGDCVIPMLDHLIEKCGASGVREVFFGMAHRGRLNVLVNSLRKPIQNILSEFEDESMHSIVGAGDVKYHMGFQSYCLTQGGARVDLTLAPNPSHLEAVNPVVEGMVRARQDVAHNRDRTAVLPLLIHGDAAVIGQGVVWETLNYSLVNGYRTGGTVHLVINNQVGFTTDPQDGRSSVYCTDPAKAVEAPIFHVNGDDVEACCHAIELALEFRNRFKKDAIVDLYCFRKYGHNEGDDPSFTQPVFYSEVKDKRPVYELYAQSLASQGVLEDGFVEQVISEFRAEFESAHQRAKEERPGLACPTFGRFKIAPAQTAVTNERLTQIAELLASSPSDFKVNPKLQKILERRIDAVKSGTGIDWGLAEALAFGTLVQDHIPVRLSGQDCGRGTFSQRHMLLTDAEEWGRRYSVLEPLSSAEAQFEVFNSTLSEFAVLGFEFGYASASPRALVLWEAQFGDFANGAQIVIDQFLASSEVKWGQFSGVTMLLPHGFEGQGPEHSSARLERFLQLCSDGNMTVCYPSKASQHFHMLRRQALSGIKRPLIVMTPKSLLRSPQAAASISELTDGSFQEIIVDDLQGGKKGSKKSSDPEVAVLLSGKVYYDVLAALEANPDRRAVRIIRMEQLYPFPTAKVEQYLKEIKAKHCIWLQEEPQNQGAWSFIRPYLEGLEIKPHYIGRQAAASTATGSAKRHLAEQQEIIAAMLAAVK